MRNIAALALGLLVVGLGLYGAAAATPHAFPGAFDTLGATTNPMALTVMLAITEVSTMFAGWLVARMVTDHRAGHALMMATVGLATAVFVGAIRFATAPAWYHVTSWVLMPVAAYIGAAAWERTTRRRGRDLSSRVATAS